MNWTGNHQIKKLKNEPMLHCDVFQNQHQIFLTIQSPTTHKQSFYCRFENSLEPIHPKLWFKIRKTNPFT